MYLSSSVLLAFLLLSAGSSSGILTVLSEDGDPVSGAVVTSGGTTLQTDSLGVAAIPREADSACVCALGFRSWAGSVPDDRVIHLSPSAVPSGVVITVTAEEGSGLRGRAPSTSRMDRDILSVPPSMSGHRLNAAAPGLFVRRYGSGMAVMSLSIRGAEAGQSGFAVDGHSLRSPFDGMGPSGLDLAMFGGGVEVARGGASSSGAGVISGAINLRSAAPSAPQHVDSWISSGGDAGARAGLSLGPTRLSASLRRLPGDAAGLSSSALLVGRSGGWRLGGLAIYGDGPTEAPTWSPDADGWRTRSAVSAWSDGVAGPLLLSLDAGGGIMDYSAKRPEEVDDSHRHLTLGGSALWAVRPWLSAGAGGGLQGVRSTALGTHRRLYGEGGVRAAGRLGTFSVRLESSIEAADDGSPGVGASLSASVPLAPDLRAYASLARSFRRPTFNDLYWPADAFAEGNDALRPETASEGELGVAGAWSGLEASACGFLALTEDQITWLPDADGVWRPRNIARVERMGVELQATATAGVLGLEGSLTVGSSVDRTEGRTSSGCRMPYRPDIVGGGRASLDMGRLSFHIDLSGRSLVYRNRTQTDWIPGYCLLGAGVRIRLHRQLFLGMDGYNLGDEDYEITDGYPGDPRTGSVMLEWREDIR